MGLFTKKEDSIEELTPVTPEQPTPTIAVAPETESAEIVNTYVDEMGIITPDTVIIGDVTTKGHLAVAGVIEGNVSAAGNLMLAGTIKGSVECNNIILDGCQLMSDIRAKGSVSIKENASVTGTIYCKHVSVMGTVIGNIKASGNVGLTKNATIRGDINASVLAVEPGAKIQGCVTVK